MPVLEEAARVPEVEQPAARSLGEYAMLFNRFIECMKVRTIELIFFCRSSSSFLRGSLRQMLLLPLAVEEGVSFSLGS